MDDRREEEVVSTSESKDSVSGEVRVERPEKRSGLAQALAPISRHPLVTTIVGGLIVILIGAYIFGIGDDAPSAPAGPAGTNRPAVDDSPDNAIEEVAAKSFWVAPPETFKGADEGADYRATVQDGDVRAADPAYLIENAPDWAADGEPVYLVGKIVAAQQPTSEYGIGYETRVRGRDRNFGVWIGTDDGPIGATGDVIYALGRVAARGETTAPSGRRIRTGYFLSLDTTEVGVVYLHNHGPAIRKAARGLGAERSDLGLPVLP